MQRRSFRHDGLTFSFLDSGGDGRPLVALHGHWMGGDDFDDLAARLSPDHRVIALDQRGFGETDHGGAHRRDAYVGDVIALLDHLGIGDAVPLIGHSFGGAVAWLVAAAHPDRVSALVVIDMDVVRDDHDDFVRDWAGVYPLREELEIRIGARLSPYLQKQIRRVEGGWSLAWDPEEFLRSEAAMNGDLWPEWLAGTCPALVVHGGDSPLVDAAVLREMVAQRPASRYLCVPGAGHSVHIDAAEALAVAVRAFLDEARPAPPA